MEGITLKGQPRQTGSRAARADRREGMVPCTLYGQRDEPVSFKVDERALHPMIYTDETHVVTVTFDGKQWECIMKAIDFDPVTDRPRHADFQVLTAGDLITITVPLQYLGTPVGQTDGGDTQYVVHEVTVRCLPKDIPSHIEVNVAELQIGDSIHVAQLESEGLEFITPDTQTLVTVVPPRLEVLDAEDEELELEEGEVAAQEDSEGVEDSEEEAES